jgi:hypothetical protein
MGVITLLVPADGAPDIGGGKLGTGKDPFSAMILLQAAICWSAGVVRAEVVSVTKNPQAPWSNSSLLGEVYLAET